MTDMNDLSDLTFNVKYKTKNTIPDRKLLVFGTGFLLGLVFFYFAGKQLIADSGLLSKKSMENFGAFFVSRQEYLLYITGIRLRQFLLVLLCTLSALAGCFLYTLLGWSGFQMGVLVYAAIYQYGVRGVFYCMFMLLPHGFFYCLTFMRMANKKIGSDKKYYHKGINITRDKRMDMCEKLKQIFVTILMLCLGILSESYINPWFMKWILIFL